MRDLPDAITSWSFEPGHTEAEFRARHMMVTWVRGLFKDIHGRVELNRDDPLGSTFEGAIGATGIWTGEANRDAHLRSADFFDVENHPLITWATPYWEGDENRGEMRRLGFEARTVIDRHDFGVSWQDEMPGGGVVVSNKIRLVLDVEAILDTDLERVGSGEAVYNT